LNRRHACRHAFACAFAPAYWGTFTLVNLRIVPLTKVKSGTLSITRRAALQIIDDSKLEGVIDVAPYLRDLQGITSQTAAARGWRVVCALHRMSL
jgi:hypothetical protein